MISTTEDEYILTHAYVPEHIVRLMTGVSGGEPFLMDDYLGFAKDNWVILVGYSLTGNPATEGFARVIAGAITAFRPVHLWFIAPAIPPSVIPLCLDRESDHYYTLGRERFELRAGLKRIVHRASKDLTVARDRQMGRGHQELIEEFLEREKPGPRIERLFLSMTEYVPASTTAVVVTARDRAGEVSAFYVVELAAKDFATYVVGCHSKRRYVVGASDLLFHEMIALAREHGKGYIHLGLGVNEGIRRFKEKWGGVQRLRYEFCEYRRKDPLGLLPSIARVWT
jgi:hypothetical protein